MKVPASETVQSCGSETQNRILLRVISRVVSSCKEGDLDPSEISVGKQLLPSNYLPLVELSKKAFEDPEIDTLHVVEHTWRLSKLEEIARQRRRLLYLAKMVPDEG